MQAVTLSYKVKLYPTQNKADTLALLTALFARHHAACTTALRAEGRCPSSKGMGEFAGRAYRRAFIDWRRTRKAGHEPGTLQAELIDAAHVQAPRHATGFDLWIMVQGVGKLYLPANKHRGLNRALSYPGAALCEQGEVFRKNGKWYCRVGVKVPLPEVAQPTGWIGVDVGVRAAVTCSDGYRGRDLRPILQRQRTRRAMDQKRGGDRRVETSPQRQLLAHEARRVVSVAQRTGRGVAVEDPTRLIRWQQHAARYFGTRVALLAALVGVAVSLVAPPYTSTTCSRCSAAQGFRRKEMFRCYACGFTTNADRNAAVNILHRATYVSCTSHHGSLSLCPGGGKVE